MKYKYLYLIALFSFGLVLGLILVGWQGANYSVLVVEKIDPSDASRCVNISDYLLNKHPVLKRVLDQARESGKASVKISSEELKSMQNSGLNAGMCVRYREEFYDISVVTT